MRCVSVRLATILASLQRDILCTHVDSTPCILLSGTRNWRDLVFDDLNARPRRWPSATRGEAVHGGFADRAERLVREATPFLAENDALVLGGHSLGGACAILMASLLHDRGMRVEAVYTYGVPQLGGRGFQRYYSQQRLWNRTTNYYTPRDPVVTRIPNVYRRVGRYTLLPYGARDAWAHHDMSAYVAALRSAAQAAGDEK